MFCSRLSSPWLPLSQPAKVAPPTQAGGVEGREGPSHCPCLFCLPPAVWLSRPLNNVDKSKAHDLTPLCDALGFALSPDEIQTSDLCLMTLQPTLTTFCRAESLFSLAPIKSVSEQALCPTSCCYSRLPDMKCYSQLLQNPSAACVEFGWKNMESLWGTENGDKQEHLLYQHRPLHTRWLQGVQNNLIREFKTRPAALAWWTWRPSHHKPIVPV